jgi:hypothetical protein
VVGVELRPNLREMTITSGRNAMPERIDEIIKVRIAISHAEMPILLMFFESNDENSSEKSPGPSRPSLMKGTVNSHALSV